MGFLLFTLFAPAAVVVMAGSVAAIPAIAKAHNLEHWFQLALVLLVSACPCALVLSTPIATFCALLRAARTGLLIKGGDVLESLASIKVAAFDKTGTITRGEFSVEEFQPVGERVSLQQLLYWWDSSKLSLKISSCVLHLIIWISQGLERWEQIKSPHGICPGWLCSIKVCGTKIREC